MKRELKFRAWVTHYDGGYMVDLEQTKGHYDFEDGFVVAFVVDGYEDFGGHERYDLEKDTMKVMQYIGLKYQDGKDVCEGDIWNHNDNLYEVVKSDNFGWALLACNEEHKSFTGVIKMHHRYRSFNWMYKTAKYSNVSGNIHENPELLKC